MKKKLLLRIRKGPFILCVALAIGAILLLADHTFRAGDHSMPRIIPIQLPASGSLPGEREKTRAFDSLQQARPGLLDSLRAVLQTIKK